MKTKKSMTKRKKNYGRRVVQIAVLGSDKDVCTSQAYKIAYEVGKEIADEGFVLITGGGGGVMEAASKGAKAASGLTIGILFGSKKESANKYCDVIIPSGIGFARDSINANSADAVILVGGGVGTLSEATYAYFSEIPIIAMVKSGGTARKYANKFLDKRRKERIIPAKSAKEALKIIKEKIKYSEKKYKYLTVHID